MSNSALSNASQPLDILDQVIIVFLVVQWCSRLNRDFVALIVAIRFDFGAQFEHMRLEMLCLKVLVQIFLIIFEHVTNFIGCFA